MGVRQQLVKLLQECKDAEAAAVSLYEKGLEETSLLSSEFLFQDKERIKTILGLLKEEAEKHRQAFEKFLQNI